MKAAILLLPLLLAANPAPEGKPLRVHAGGRFVAAGEALRFGWPGVYIEGRFRGTKVTVWAEAKAESLRVLIDGKPGGTIAPGDARLALTGLTPGEHVVRLEKV